MSQKFTSMPNFRGFGSSTSSSSNNGSNSNNITDSRDDDNTLKLDNSDDGTVLKLYRSSRPDFLTEEEVERFRSLGIRCIIDFRSTTEYRKANGSKLLDKLYPVYKVKLPLGSRYKPGEIISCIPVNSSADTYNNGNNVRQDSEVISESSSGSSVEEIQEQGISSSTSGSTDPLGKHLLINFFKMQYIWAVYYRAPWYIKLYSLLYLLADVILGTGYRYFVRVFARYVLNKEGLYGQYIDMIEYSQTAICAALKLLCESENVPAMLNCAHGKDRTGIVSALVLASLGKSKHFIATDYARSEMELLPMKERLYAEIVEKFHMCKTFTTAKYETMMRVLEYIDNTYGSVEDYLESLAFSRSDQLRLRANLITLSHDEKQEVIETIGPEE